MSLEREKLEKLIERIDELLVVLNKVSEDLRAVSASIKSLAVAQLTQPPLQVAPPVTIPEAYEKKKFIEDVKMMFPEELDNLLDFDEKGDYIIIKPRQFLGSENFAKIASTVRGIGGEYISAGRESHFRVPKKRI